MTPQFRQARRDDVVRIVDLLADDPLGSTRESPDLTPYLAAFDALQNDPANLLIVGEGAGKVIATYQLTFITGLSLRAARRAQIESVRVDPACRGLGIGRLMMADAEARARAAGCTLLQLTTNIARTRAHAFYEAIGFTPSHIGFKRGL